MLDPSDESDYTSVLDFRNGTKTLQNYYGHGVPQEARWRFRSAVRAASSFLDDRVMSNSVRQLSWLESNCRVLEQVRDPRVPLRERMKFLAILSANIDEFFTVHGAQLASGAERDGDRSRDRSGWDDLQPRLRRLVDEHHRYFLEELQPRLAADGIVVLQTEHISDAQRGYLAEYFRRAILPALTPLAIDPGHPFPHLRHGSVYLAARLWASDSAARSSFPRAGLSMIHVPNSVLPRFVPVPDPARPHAFVLLDHVIQLHLPALYRDYEVLSSHGIRVTRSSSRLYPARPDEAGIPCGPAVRLEHDESLPADILATLLDGLELSGESAYAGRSFAAFGDLHQLYAAVSPSRFAHAPSLSGRSPLVPAPDIWSVIQVDGAAREATRRAEPAHLSTFPRGPRDQRADTVERRERWA
jgi:polyphosphate kinase